MKKVFLLSFLFVLFSIKLFSNNLVIGAPTYNASTNKITFTIKWDNSWRVNTGPSNWDAVWVFVKRQPCGANGIWSHAILSSTSSEHAVSGTFGLVADAVADGMGVFVHRPSAESNAIGSFSTTSEVSLKLSGVYNPELTGSSSSSDNFKVIGIEMVYVPQGQFYIGDGRNITSNSFSNSGSASPLLINAIKQTNGLGDYSNYVTDPSYGSVVSLPGTFPLGYNAFYCMKYEVNQQQIVDYLNTLSYDQQASRIGVWSGRVPSTVGTYFSFALNNFRQEIKVVTAGTNNTIPAVFGLTNTYNAFIPAGYLNWQDLTSYLDWAGLRPMTEFEYEKVARGTVYPVSNEFAWGTTKIGTSNGNFSNTNTSAESSNTIYDGNCWYNHNNGPIRSGFAATANSNRSQAGAAYYGVMELSGNLYEQCVGGAGFNYSSFTTTNGDGALTNAGLADVIGWPKSGGLSSGTIFRGGAFNTSVSEARYCQISDRSFYQGQSENGNTTRNREAGGRGVRSF